MSGSFEISDLFSRRNKLKNRQRSRRQSRRDRQARPAMESLEKRAMLAFTALPVGGDQFGAPIVVSSDASDSSHVLRIDFDDVTAANLGSVVATITPTVNGVAGTPISVYNFNSISYYAHADSDGSVDNKLFVGTPYETN
ncbi:MAG: hypothetical protein RLZZ440_2983, partial [Planctomycetota bacterium]